MKRISIILIIFSLFNIYNAFALHCGSHVIAEGVKTSEVLLKCGDATVYERWKEENLIYKVDSVINNEGLNLDQIETKHFEEWTYNFGPKKVVYFLFFIDGKLNKIETGLQGFKGESPRNTSYSKCLSKVVPGERVIDVTRQCGKASIVEYGQENRLIHNIADKANLKEKQKYRKNALEINIEEWTYHFKSQQLLIFIRFENGKVVKIEQGNY